MEPDAQNGNLNTQKKKPIRTEKKR